MNVPKRTTKRGKTIMQTATALKESHRRQFNGEDYQAVAQDLCDRMQNPTQEDYEALSASPDPGCECGFCETAPWEN